MLIHLAIGVTTGCTTGCNTDRVSRIHYATIVTIGVTTGCRLCTQGLVRTYLQLLVHVVTTGLTIGRQTVHTAHC